MDESSIEAMTTKEGCSRKIKLGVSSLASHCLKDGPNERYKGREIIREKKRATRENHGRKDGKDAESQVGEIAWSSALTLGKRSKTGEFDVRGSPRPSTP